VVKNTKNYPDIPVVMDLKACLKSNLIFLAIAIALESETN